MIEGWEYDVINQVPFSKKKGLADSNLYVVNTPQEWEAFFKLLMDQKTVACDTETSGFEYYEDKHIVGMSFGWEKDHFYVPVRHVASYTGGDPLPQLNIEDLLPDLKTFFSRKDIFTIWHNWKFDAHFYYKEGVEIKTPFHDTTTLWHLVDENAPKALKSIASGWTDVMRQKHKGMFGPEAAAKEKEVSNWRAAEAKAHRTHFSSLVMKRADELRPALEHQDKNRNQLKKWIIENELSDHPDRGFKKDEVHYGMVPIPLMTEYAAIDTFLTFALYRKTMGEINFTKDLVEVYTNEIKLSRVLFDSEEKGALIGEKYILNLEEELTAECEALANDIYKTFGRKFNLKSSDLLSQALIEQGVVLTKKTKTGKWTLDQSVLEKLSKEYPIVDDILYLRGSEKILNTYVRGIARKIQKSPYIHMNFNQNVTTGRMSCSEPNVQNIPRSDTRIRKAFICPEGYYFIFSDYSQVEVRLTAHYSEDPLMLDAYEKDQDIHTRTACEMFDLDYDHAIAVLLDDKHEHYKKFKEYRDTAKTINFGIIYGVGAPGLSHQIDRPDRYKDAPDSVWIDACQDYIDQYFHKYKYVKRFVNRCTRMVKKDAQITNYFGRIRHLPHINAYKLLGKEFSWMSGRAERQAPNFVIQSTAADVFKFATVRVAEEVFKGTQSHIVNLVHDEIQSYVHEDELHLLNKKKDVMEDFGFLVPLKVSFAYSTESWADKKELAA